MPRTVILTPAALERFEKAVLAWWLLQNESGKPSADKVAEALQCDRRTILRLRKGEPNDRGLLIFLFAAHLKPLSKTDPALWELTDADFLPSDKEQKEQKAGRLFSEADHLYQGADYAEAEQKAQASLLFYRGAGNKAGEASLYALLGQIKLAQGKFEEALEQVDCASSFFPGEQDRSFLGRVYDLRGSIYLRMGKLEPSRKDFLRCLTLWSEIGHLHGTVDAQLSLVGVETEAKCSTQARLHLENARKTLCKIKDGPLTAYLFLREARLLLLEGELLAARQCAERALQFWTFAGHPRWKGLSHLVLAEIAHARQHPQETRDHAEQSLNCYTEAGDHYGMEKARKLLPFKQAAAVVRSPASASAARP